MTILSDNVKICKYCGKEFNPGPKGYRRKYCDGPHFKTCEYCGKEFEILDIANFIPKTCSKECSNKLRITGCHDTVKLKYGVDNISQSEQFKETIANSLRNVAPEVVEKRKQTMISRYGQDSPMKIDEFRAKIFATNTERYGHTNPAKSDEVRAKISAIVSSEDWQRKYCETCLQHWGVSRPSKLREVQERMIATNLDRYGVPYVTQDSEMKKKSVDKLREYRENNPVGAPSSNLSGYKISKINKLVGEELEAHGQTVCYEFRLEDRYYDIVIPDKNILIEIDPTYTHNMYGNHWTDEGLPNDYHLKKTQLATKYGYRCIHIFDWDNIIEIIKLVDTEHTKYYARNLIIKKLTKEAANKFLDTNHLQGRCGGNEINLGLYNDDDLVQLMTFGKPRYNKNYQYELLRLCTKSGAVVVGGSEKLFKYFVKNFNPASVISYCEASKFKGDVYSRLGMTFVRHTEPAKVWSKGQQKITDNLLRQRGYDQLFNTSYGKGTSNEKLMVENGWLPVYDCGQLVFEYINKEEG